MQLPSAEDVEYWHGEEKAGWLQSQARRTTSDDFFWGLRSMCLQYAQMSPLHVSRTFQTCARTSSACCQSRAVSSPCSYFVLR